MSAILRTAVRRQALARSHGSLGCTTTTTTTTTFSTARASILRTPAAASVARSFHSARPALYEYDKDIYGFRTPRVFETPDYSEAERGNRNDNANLVRLVHMYRLHGHKAAEVDPLGITHSEKIFQLDPARYGIADPKRTFPVDGIVHVGEAADPAVSKSEAPLEEIIAHLRKSYCGRIGYEFTHIENLSERKWFAQLVESYNYKKMESTEKKRIFELLSKSEVFDHFMAKKFPQVKRYGLEGAESMMIVLDTLFKEANLAGIRDVVMCMPHRGRLNLLTDLFEYDPTALFHKVKGNAEFPEDIPAAGDVLSHLATSVDLTYGAQKTPVHVAMLHNPSHLEAANPVALGKARAKQMYMYEAGQESDCYIGDRVMCVQMHGDAAFCGQGVVTETLGLANLPHFTAGGSVHVIVNNQIGYTTPAMNARSSYYSSDVAKMISCPVIHVNADHPEDVAHATAIAFEYRNKFRKDVIIDLIAYRRMGHNELDEPSFTQPAMYKNIRARPSVPKLYEQKLTAEGVVSDSAAIETMRTDYFNKLDKHLEASYNYTPKADTLKNKWSTMTIPTTAVTTPNTGVAIDTLRDIGRRSIETPEGTAVHPRVQKYHIDARLRKVEDGNAVDWASAEAMAFGSLLLEGSHVRISGQDVGRGTFSQRHAMLVDQNTERTTIPLNNLVQSGTSSDSTNRQGKLEIANSSLSEFAVLGFEYGVSWETPNRLCIWEAQFGDFFNGAQIIIDTFINSGETKWLRQSGLVMLLPHGYENGGPEHSSCRIERFLQLCDQTYDVNEAPGDVNMHVVNPTTPAQYFHVLRRQLHRNYRKPLIIASPKSLLRHPLCTSPLSAMEPGTTFLPVIDDPSRPTSPKRVMFVSGKIYYELVKERTSRGLESDVAIVRVEELCPLPIGELRDVVEGYASDGAVEWTWVQEEPQNQGAYTFVEPRLRELLPEGAKLNYHGRKPSAAPATGISKRYRIEQDAVVKGAF